MVEEREEKGENALGDSSALRREDELVWAEDLTNHFVKTVSAYKTYPLNDPTMRMRDQLMDKFRFLLEKVDCITWNIAEYEIYYKDEIVYENTEAKSSLAFYLYREGLEQVRFEKGLQEWEVVDFVDAIAKADTLNSLEDDLNTLLWERDFQHIHYVAGQYHLEESPIEFADNVEDFRKALTPAPIPNYQQGELIREHELAPGFLHQRLEASGSEVSEDQLRVQPEEMKALKETVDVETQPEFCFHAIETLFEVMELETKPHGFGAIVSFLNRVIDSLLGKGDFRQASQILRRLYIYLNSHNLQEWQDNLIKKTVIEAGESPRIEIIGNMLKGNEFSDIKGAFDYFLLLQRNSIPHLCKLLGNLSGSKPRRIICDALSNVGRNNIELMTPFLGDKRWYLVRNIVYILGRIGRKEAVQYVGKALQHEDLRVRREALQALGLIGGSEAMQYMIRSLEDPDIKIRGIAALNMGRMGEEALTPLMEKILSKEFYKKELREIKAYFKAIGMIRSDHSIPLLYSLLRRRRWFGRTRVDEIRACAIETLVKIGTKEAKEVLEIGTGSREEPLREACRQALMEFS
ncbi:MAG: HEAT repeat domain-containing protein [Syntrophobacterales bacterium]|nr:MAG: HEAT repeat domain-containing protein [Syntrophobacterales bacterium]